MTVSDLNLHARMAANHPIPCGLILVFCPQACCSCGAEARYSYLELCVQASGCRQRGRRSWFACSMQRKASNQSYAALTLLIDFGRIHGDIPSIECLPCETCMCTFGSIQRDVRYVW
jgi:hypothetical protein